MERLHAIGCRWPSPQPSPRGRGSKRLLNGAVWHCVKPLLAYFKRDFHPDQEAFAAPEQQTRSLARRWLKEHADSFRVVR
jgi:hypothetical protein